MIPQIATVTFTTQVIPLPPATVPAGYLAELFLDGTITASQSLASSDQHATFVIEEAGEYVCSVSRMADDGTVIGSTVYSDTFVVSEEMVETPLAVTVSLLPAVATPKTVRVR